jgi:ElaA protein
LYDILRLRAEVFVAEQECVYVDPDGRDLEPGTRHLWIEDPEGVVVSTLRVLAEPDGGSAIGRVVTAPIHRSRGLAARLVRGALACAPRPVRINAQSQLADWYRAFGFVAEGDEFVEDGIAHVPMVLS